MLTTTEFQQLKFPTIPDILLNKRNSIRKVLINDKKTRIQKRIAILGGSTTHNIIQILELFLLYHGIKPVFYESDYNQYYENIMFNNARLISFKPDIIIFHTSFRNIKNLPSINDTEDNIQSKLNLEYNHFKDIWEKCLQDYRCIIIQNNFEQPWYRLLGNKDVSDLHGYLNFINQLNIKFYEYAQKHNNFYINDLNYIASNYGLSQWHDLSAWYLYKYCCKIQAIPLISYSYANIIKSIYGKNKKGFVLDLDNTLWGGIIGDDGIEHIEIGQETAAAQAYTEFQEYLKKYKELGVILAINSKNDEENALLGLKHPDSILKTNDFLSIKTNWHPKSQNLEEIAQELNVLPESLVFIDDNPMERDLVQTQLSEVAVPEISCIENYIKEIDRNSYFEITSLSNDDLSRIQMYQENIKRKQEENLFQNYDEYLKSLNMKAKIKAFNPLYFQRITQLTNKSNQFNLTTKRYTLSEIENISKDENYLTLYGKLSDKFGDNGVVSIIIAKKKEKTLHIELFLMSCRVLKRKMEYAMMDTLVKLAHIAGIHQIRGYYYKTQKNNMVSDLYKDLGFKLEKQNNDGTIWNLSIKNYISQQNVIRVEN